MFLKYISYSKWNKTKRFPNFSSAVEYATREKKTMRGLAK
jgi:hypothetical protein